MEINPVLISQMSILQRVGMLVEFDGRGRYAPEIFDGAEIFVKYLAVTQSRGEKALYEAASGDVCAVVVSDFDHLLERVFVLKRKRASLQSSKKKPAISLAYISRPTAYLTPSTYSPNVSKMSFKLQCT